LESNEGTDSTSGLDQSLPDPASALTSLSTVASIPDPLFTHLSSAPAPAQAAFMQFASAPAPAQVAASAPAPAPWSSSLPLASSLASAHALASVDFNNPLSNPLFSAPPHPLVPPLVPPAPGYAEEVCTQESGRLLSAVCCLLSAVCCLLPVSAACWLA
jgi:hypothetical protein